MKRRATPWEVGTSTGHARTTTAIIRSGARGSSGVANGFNNGIASHNFHSRVLIALVCGPSAHAIRTVVPGRALLNEDFQSDLVTAWAPRRTLRTPVLLLLTGPVCGEIHSAAVCGLRETGTAGEAEVLELLLSNVTVLPVSVFETLPY